MLIRLLLMGFWVVMIGLISQFKTGQNKPDKPVREAYILASRIRLLREPWLQKKLSSIGRTKQVLKDSYGVNQNPTFFLWPYFGPSFATQAIGVPRIMLEALY